VVVFAPLCVALTGRCWQSLVMALMTGFIRWSAPRFAMCSACITASLVQAFYNRNAEQ